MSRRLLSILLATCLFTSATGCQTIMHGAKQKVSIGSSPGRAKVWVNGDYLGRTPVLREFSRKGDHAVKIQMEGYEPFEVTLEHKVTKWVLGSFFLGLGIGLFIDAVTGALYYIEPDQIHAILKKQAPKTGP